MIRWTLPWGHPSRIHETPPARPPADPDEEKEAPVVSPPPFSGGIPPVPHPDLPQTEFFDARDVQGQFTEEA